MEKIQWDDRFSVGCGELDDHHKQLIALINELILIAGQKEEHVVVGRVLEQLIDYLEVHFKAEEAFMRKIGYPHVDRHRKIHEGFLRRTLEFNKCFNARHVEITEEIIQFLMGWLVNHILSADQEYAAYSNESVLI